MVGHVPVYVYIWSTRTQCLNKCTTAQLNEEEEKGNHFRDAASTSMRINSNNLHPYASSAIPRAAE